MKLIYLLVLMTVATFASAQNMPDWVESKGNSPRYADDKYVTGYGITAFSKHDDLQKINQLAEENAKKNLCEKIKVQVTSSTKTLKQQTNLNFEQKLS